MIWNNDYSPFRIPENIVTAAAPHPLEPGSLCNTLQITVNDES